MSALLAILIDKEIPSEEFIDHEGTVLDCVVTKKRDKKAARKVLNKLVKSYGKPQEIVTDKLKSYRAALKEFGLHYLQNTSNI